MFFAAATGCVIFAAVKTRDIEERKCGFIRGGFMLTSGEIIKKFGISKNSLDTITRRYKKKWNLTKDSAGRFVWDKYALEKLKAYLQARSQQTAMTVEMVATPHFDPGKLLAATKMIAEKISEMAEVHRGVKHEIKEMKMKHAVTVRELTREVHSLRMRLGNTQAQFEKKNIILAQRLERRKPSTSILNWLFKLLHSPVLLIDRRKD
ncbi:hypothetical protein ACFL35_07385 [Candidatus Riflebacteria bacterium]